MRYTKNQELRVVDNVGCHSFKIGEKVIVREVNIRDYIVSNDRLGEYYMQECELEAIM